MSGILRVRATLGSREITAEVDAGALEHARRVHEHTAAVDPDPKLALHRLIWGVLDRKPWGRDIAPEKAVWAVLALLVATGRADELRDALEHGDYDVDYIATKTGENDYEGATAVTPRADGAGH